MLILPDIRLIWKPDSGTVKVVPFPDLRDKRISGAFKTLFSYSEDWRLPPRQWQILSQNAFSKKPNIWCVRILLS